MSEEFIRHEHHLNEIQKVTIFINIAITFFYVQQYHKSIAWLNRIRNELSINIFQDVDRFIRIFYLIVHYEAGNYDLLPYLIQSAYRFLRKKEHLYKFETIFIYFLRNELPKASKPKELIQVFQKLKTQLIPLEKDPYEKNAFTYFDYISWLESKIENRPFAEVVKEKARNNLDVA